MTATKSFRALRACVHAGAPPRVLTPTARRPGYSKLTRGEGMPVPKSAARGNLVLNFKLVFPDYLSEEKKRALSTLL